MVVCTKIRYYTSKSRLLLQVRTSANAKPENLLNLIYALTILTFFNLHWQTSRCLILAEMRKHPKPVYYVVCFINGSVCSIRYQAKFGHEKYRSIIRPLINAICWKSISHR